MSENKHGKHLDEVNRYSNEQFDKSILFIASGALGISFAFITDVVPDFSEAKKTGLLIASWSIFGAVIFLSLVSHFISMQASAWALKNEHLKRKKFNKGVMYWNWPIRILNLTAIVAILTGIILLISFINQNI